MSHTMTEQQKKDARDNLGIKEFIALPEQLLKIWGNIPPEKQNISDIINKFENWVLQNYNEKDIVLVQGDFGMIYGLVSRLKVHNIKCCYATTKRIATELRKDDEVIKTSTFKHIIYRFYN